jgi:hypothetical protein
MSNTKLTWPDVEARLARAQEVVTAGGVKVTAAETPNAFVIANGGGAAYTVQFGQVTPRVGHVHLRRLAAARRAVQTSAGGRVDAVAGPAGDLPGEGPVGRPAGWRRAGRARSGRARSCAKRVVARPDGGHGGGRGTERGHRRGGPGRSDEGGVYQLNQERTHDHAEPIEVAAVAHHGRRLRRPATAPAPAR